MNQRTTSGGISLRPRTNRGTAVTASKSARARAPKRIPSYQLDIEEEDVVKRGRKRVSDKGKEEANELEDISSFHDESDMVVVEKKQPGQISVAPMDYEIVNRQQILDGITANTTYMRALIDEVVYLRSHAVVRTAAEHARNQERLKELDQRILDTSRALEGWGCPIVRWSAAGARGEKHLVQDLPDGEMVHPVAPSIPQADGSEYRFTQVANNLGLQWSKVDDDVKQDIYNKAAQYHKDAYGVFPNKVRVWTKFGLRPVYYYNKDTYEATMERAIQEYMNI